MRNICISQQQLNFFTKRLNEDQKSELMQVLTKVSGGFQIKWVADSIQKRREYSESRRKNRQSKPKKTKNISSSYVNHMDNEDEIVNENENEKLKSNTEFENEIFEDWISWGKLIVDGNDQHWEALRGRKVSKDEMDSFISVATRNKWKIETQGEFRISLNGFKPTGQPITKSNGVDQKERMKNL